MWVFDIMAWVVVVLGTLATIYTRRCLPPDPLALAAPGVGRMGGSH